MEVEITKKNTLTNVQLPSEWDLKSIGDLCTIYVGRDLKETLYSKIRSNEFNYPVYSNTVEEEGLYGYYNFKEFTGESLTIVGRGAGLGTAFTRKGSYGAIGRLLVLFPNEKVSAHYITEYVNNKLNIHQESGGIPQLTGQQITGYKIIIPEYPEQKAIAKVLSIMDSAINANNQLIAQKELRKKWLMQNLLTGKKRLKGFSEEWKEFKYGSVLQEVKRNIEWDDNELYKLISVRRRSGGIFFRDALYGHQIKVKNLRNVETGDYLISKMQILHGASALVTDEFEDAKISGSYIAVVAKNPSILNMEFFNWLSKLKYFYHQTYVSSYGVHIEKMTFDFKSFLSLECVLPSIEEQTAIAQVLQAVDKELNLLRAKTDKLKEQKKGIMQVLLTGKKRLNINIESV
ncbi:restriction endonuclease subunit S [Flavobacteriaceae bacterium KMM 6898]|nr:restriction endonuclease subunit S [Flavobacteriaceae bacterium KMM 6898]